MSVDRQCGKCVACCSGELPGTVNGHSFYSGNPCHYLDMEKGCSIYENRPESPCREFSCEWLLQKNDIPLWMRPDLSGVILHKKSDVLYMNEYNGIVKSNVLNWTIHYAVRTNTNLVYFINGVLQKLDVK